MENKENMPLDELLKKADSFLKISNKALAESKAMDEAIAFVLEQWQTNKRWFREEPGRVTTEDVIKVCIEYAWASKAKFGYTYKEKQ